MVTAALSRQKGIGDPVLRLERVSKAQSRSGAERMRRMISYREPLSSRVSKKAGGGTGNSYLSVVGLADTEEGLERVVGGDKEAGRVNEELAGNIEEDEEKVQGAEAEDDVDLWHRRLLLKVVEVLVL